jgi:hypothetical protein
MHCQACNRLLSDFESTRKHAITFEFLDLCKVCFEDVKTIIPTIDRRELITEHDFDEEPEDDMDTEVSLEDDDLLYSYVVDSRDDYDV